MTLRIRHYFSPIGYTIWDYKTVNKHRKYAVFGKQFVMRFTDSGIILDIYECEINRFVQDNHEELTKMEGYCWLVDYDTEQELIAFLTGNEYKYIKIESSYGMSGWILAKSYRLIE